MHYVYTHSATPTEEGGGGTDILKLLVSARIIVRVTA